MRHERILIVDDEKLIRWSIRERLQEEGYTILEAGSGKQALALVEEEECDLLLLDYRLPDMTGIDILKAFRQDHPEISGVMMTAYGPVETAVEAMKLGAHDYLTKPVQLDELTMVVQKALEATFLRREVRRLRRERQASAGRTNLVGGSLAMRRVMELIDKIVVSRANTVLIEGESGTGKNLVARAIHYGSARADRPLVTITCSAITETLLESELFGHERGAFTDAKVQKKGLLEMADGGTAFLDEIGDMSPSMQARLLRFLEDHTFKRVGGTRDIHVDVRVIAATNRRLADAVREKTFREDLYYRLRVIPILLPPLRQRTDDIPLLVQHFLDLFNAEFHKDTRGITPEAMERLMAHPWHGNIRELRNVIERIMILENKEQIDVPDLPGDLTALNQTTTTPGQPLSEPLLFPLGRMTLEQMEEMALRQALLRTGHNQVRAARLLGISRDTLRYRLKKLDPAHESGMEDESTVPPEATGPTPAE